MTAILILPESQTEALSEHCDSCRDAAFKHCTADDGLHRVTCIVCVSCGTEVGTWIDRTQDA